jgi:endo-1,4-beta-D-glucanase Y
MTAPAWGLRLAAAAILLMLCGVAAPALAEDPNWSLYKSRFIDADGRLFDDSADNVSHSEGQGYALVLAAFNDDRATFARVWSWTLANLEIRGDHLAAWRWRPEDHPHALDTNNATDGDLLIAWGLAEAGRRWGLPEYGSQARQIALALGRKVFFASRFGPALRPGVAGFGVDDAPDGPLVNLSYWVFPAIDALAELAPEVDWPGVRRSGLALFDAARFGPAHLPADWLSLRDGVAPAKDRPALFGYELVRAPLYLAWGTSEAKPRLAALTQSWLEASAGALSLIDVDTGKPTQSFADEGYLAVAALARCAAEGTKFPEQLRHIEAKRYYPTTLHMLSLTAIRLWYPRC